MSRQYAVWSFSSLLLISVLARPAFAGSDDAAIKPGLSVENTSLALTQPDGPVLKGTDLQGRVLNLPIDGLGLRAVRLAAIRVDPDDAEILQHESQLQNAAGEWRSACAPNADGETWGIPVAPGAG